MDYFDHVDENLGLLDAHAQAIAPRKSAPGQRLLKWLTWAVIAVLLVYGLVLTTAHVLARIVGMPRAQIVLAQLYSGEYWWHPADDAYAKELLREAVIAGDTEAQYKLASSYETDKNYAQAFPLYQDLALRGWTGAENRLGVMYLYGRAVTRNSDTGIKWLKKSAAQGDVIAHLFLGAIYSEGLPDLQPDVVQGAQWMQSAAYLGNGRAQDYLARLYARGEGVPKNLDMAIYWANRSVDSGYKPARETLLGLHFLKEGKN